MPVNHDSNRPSGWAVGAIAWRPDIRKRHDADPADAMALVAAREVAARPERRFRDQSNFVNGFVSVGLAARRLTDDRQRFRLDRLR